LLAGAVILGLVVSSIVTVWVAVLMLPLSSIAIHMIVVAPERNIAGAVLRTVTGSKISEAVAVP